MTKTWRHERKGPQQNIERGYIAKGIFFLFFEPPRSIDVFSNPFSQLSNPRSIAGCVPFLKAWTVFKELGVMRSLFQNRKESPFGGWNHRAVKRRRSLCRRRNGLRTDRKLRLCYSHTFFVSSKIAISGVGFHLPTKSSCSDVKRITWSKSTPSSDAAARRMLLHNPREVEKIF